MILRSCRLLLFRREEQNNTLEDDPTPIATRMPMGDTPQAIQTQELRETV